MCSEWAVNIQRDSYASYVGHYPILAYFALAENESIGRERYNFMQVLSIPLLLCLFMTLRIANFVGCFALVGFRKCILDVFSCVVVSVFRFSYLFVLCCITYPLVLAPFELNSYTQETVQTRTRKTMSSLTSSFVQTSVYKN